MSKGLRVFLRIFQVLFLLAALLFMVFTFLMAYMDFGATALEERFVDTWVMGFALLAIAFSPSLWSLKRDGAQAATGFQSMGSYDAVPGQAPSGPQQQRPGSAFEPMGNDRAPAPPASSYGQPSAGGFPSQGGITPASPPPSDSPWGGR